MDTWFEDLETYQLKNQVSRIFYHLFLSNCKYVSGIFPYASNALGLT